MVAKDILTRGMPNQMRAQGNIEAQAAGASKHAIITINKAISITTLTYSNDMCAKDVPAIVRSHRIGNHWPAIGNLISIAGYLAIGHTK